MQKSIELQSNGLTLRGMLHTPQEMIHTPDGIEKNVPLICIFHGFTGNKMEPHFIFVKLSRMLAAKGIASIRFDFGCSGESDGDFVDMTISKELEDAKNILNFVKTLDFVDSARIGVVGLSMGGAVASMLAGDCKEDIQSLCLWAPAGNMAELVTRDRTQEDLNKIKNVGYFDLGGFLLGNEFVKDIFSVDIFGKAAAYDKNILILHGDKDAAVPLSTSEKYLEIYEEKAVLHVIEGGDHTFNSKAFEDEVLDYTLGFFQGEFNI